MKNRRISGFFYVSRCRIHWKDLAVIGVFQLSCRPVIATIRANVMMRQAGATVATTTTTTATNTIFVDSLGINPATEIIARSTHRTGEEGESQRPDLLCTGDGILQTA